MIFAALLVLAVVQSEIFPLHCIKGDCGGHDLGVQVTVNSVDECRAKCEAERGQGCRFYVVHTHALPTGLHCATKFTCDAVDTPTPHQDVQTYSLDDNSGSGQECATSSGTCQPLFTDSICRPMTANIPYNCDNVNVMCIYPDSAEGCGLAVREEKKRPGFPNFQGVNYFEYRPSDNNCRFATTDCDGGNGPATNPGTIHTPGWAAHAIGWNIYDLGCIGEDKTESPTSMPTPAPTTSEPTPAPTPAPTTSSGTCQPLFTDSICRPMTANIPYNCDNVNVMCIYPDSAEGCGLAVRAEKKRPGFPNFQGVNYFEYRPSDNNCRFTTTDCDGGNGPATNPGTINTPGWAAHAIGWNIYDLGCIGEDPTVSPTLMPTSNPTSDPTYGPTHDPTISPTSEPTFTPTVEPTFAPSNKPTFMPTFVPTNEPTFSPTSNPTVAPTSNPTFVPTSNPTFVPTSNPTFVPTNEPTFAPSNEPTFAPSNEPTFVPTNEPTFVPTSDPTFVPTNEPTFGVFHHLLANDCTDIKKWYKANRNWLTWIDIQDHMLVQYWTDISVYATFDDARMDFLHHCRNL